MPKTRASSRSERKNPAPVEKTYSRKRTKQLKKLSWEGFEDYRDLLYAAAHRSLEAYKVLEATCIRYHCDPCHAAFTGLQLSKEGFGISSSRVAQYVYHPCDTRSSSTSTHPTYSAAINNANVLFEVVRIQGELVGKHGFDAYFVQSEWESIMCPSFVLPGYKPGSTQ